MFARLFRAPINKEPHLNRMTYKIDEVATMLGLGRTTIYKLIDEGQLSRIKVGARTLIPVSDVEALLQREAA